MRAPTLLYPDPTRLRPPHGPDHDCRSCERLRRVIGHVPLDAETVRERSHEVALIATQLELADSGWPGEGAKADIARLQGARRIAWARWMAEVGEISDR